MKAFLAAFVVILSITSSVYSLSCAPGPCDKSSCAVLNCRGGEVKGQCGCCNQCAKVEGKECGGDFDMHGVCDEGLKCYHPEDIIVGPGIIAAVDRSRHVPGTCGVAYKSCDEACAASFVNQPAGLSSYGRSVYFTPDFDNKGFWGYCDCSGFRPWMVIQRRDMNAISFDQTYQQYEDGFGFSTADYWMGLNRIHGFTKDVANHPYEMRIVVKYANDAWNSVESFPLFSVGDAESSYALNIRAGFSPGSGEFASQHDGIKFSAKDQDNDRWIAGSCAKAFSSGFWFNRCTTFNLNGVMYGTHFSPVPPNYENDDGPDRISWNSCFGQEVEAAEMWIRPIRY